MRQLLAMGWMHNRVRMVAAMYLCKDLLIDWRRGEAWFMSRLVDGFFASNNGGWQWSASTGTDAAPYFRVFNPVLQSRKTDPDGQYIRRWVPELASLDAKEIHDPPPLARAALKYPEPIVDHALARERAIGAYAGATRELSPSRPSARRRP
jgi:deoxyribodipyrimidine photo-lyase